MSTSRHGVLSLVDLSTYRPLAVRWVVTSAVEYFLTAVSDLRIVDKSGTIPASFTFLGVPSSYRLHAGGNWNNSSYCGPRSVNLNNVSANLNANNGGRGASDTRFYRICQTPRLEQ